MSCGQKYAKQMKGRGMIGEGNWNMKEGKRQDMHGKGVDGISYEDEGWAELVGTSQKRRKEYRDNIQSITRPSIKNMSIVAQIENFSRMSFELIRKLMYAYLNEIISKTIIVSQYKKHKTVLKKDVVFALHNVDPSFRLSHYYDNFDDIKEDIKRCLRPDVSLQEKKEKQEQVRKEAAERHGTCIYTRPTGFVRLIREVLSHYTTDMRLSQDAALYIQLLTEQFTIETMMRTNLVARHAGRNTVMNPDFIIVLRLRNFKLLNFPIHMRRYFEDDLSA